MTSVGAPSRVAQSRMDAVSSTWVVPSVMALVMASMLCIYTFLNCSWTEDQSHLLSLYIHTDEGRGPTNQSRQRTAVAEYQVRAKRTGVSERGGYIPLFLLSDRVRNGFLKTSLTLVDELTDEAWGGQSKNEKNYVLRRFSLGHFRKEYLFRVTLRQSTYFIVTARYSLRGHM
jgi:hypothetical protein